MFSFNDWWANLYNYKTHNLKSKKNKINFTAKLDNKLIRWMIDRTSHALKGGENCENLA